jgi:hypothetical protein
MSKDSVEIVAFHDENVNSSNLAPTRIGAGLKENGNQSVKIQGNLLMAPTFANSIASNSLEKVSTPNSTDRKCQQSNVVSPQSPSDDDDEIMQFRAYSSDSDDEATEVPQHIPPQKTSNYMALMDSLNMATYLRMLPTILEVTSANTEDSSDVTLSHEGTECVSAQESIELEDVLNDKCEDGNNKITKALDAAPYVMPSSPNFKATGLKSSTFVNEKSTAGGAQPQENGSMPVSDLYKELEDLESILAGTSSAEVASSPRKDTALAPAASPAPSRDDALSPVTSPRHIGNPALQMQAPPRQIEDPAQISSPRRQPLDPISPRQTQEPTEVITASRQRQDPPCRLLELNDQVVKRRFSVEEAEVKANRHKKELDEQLMKTKELSKQLRKMRKAEAMLQADLQKELKEVALQNEALQADIKRLELTKKELQDARSEVEDEEDELNELKEQLKSDHEALEEEVSAGNKAMQDEIEKLVATKQELAEAKFKAEKEEAELALMKKEYERQLQLLEQEKEQLGLAMEAAQNETNETNELTRQTLSELEEYKANVQADMILVREMHESQMQILVEEKEKLQAAQEQASKETTEVKGMTKQILEDLESVTKKEEAEVTMLRKEYAERMRLLEQEKEKLADAMEEAANETTETKDMTRTVKSELEEYKVKLEVDMQNEIKDMKREIRRYVICGVRS